MAETDVISANGTLPLRAGFVLGFYRKLGPMDTNTLLIIIVVILLLGGGGFYYRGRR